MGEEAKVRQMREQIQTIRSILLNQHGSNGTASSTSLSTISSPTYQLNPQILPPHRIAFTSTTKGRIAFVRQLSSKSEFVIDYDTAVKNELERFGFRVLIYPKMTTSMNAMKVGEGEGGSTTSALGKFLIP